MKSGPLVHLYDSGRYQCSVVVLVSVYGTVALWRYAGGRAEHQGPLPRHTSTAPRASA